MPSRKNTVQWWDTPSSWSARSTNQKESRYKKNLEGLFPVAAAAAAASSPATKRTQFNVWLNEAIAAREAKAPNAKQDPFANLVNLSKEAAVSANRGGKRK